MEKLTYKEEEAMEFIWQLGPCAPKDVLQLYPDPKPHINTVSGLFQMLERKGYLTHEPKGRGYIYSPAVEQSEYGRKKMNSFVKRYFGSSYMSVVSAFVKEEKVTEEEILEFLNEIKK